MRQVGKTRKTRACLKPRLSPLPFPQAAPGWCAGCATQRREGGSPNRHFAASAPSHAPPGRSPHFSAGQLPSARRKRPGVRRLGGAGLHPQPGTEGELPKHNTEAAEHREPGPMCQGEIMGSQLLKPAQEARPRSQGPHPKLCCRRSPIPKAFFFFSFPP